MIKLILNLKFLINTFNPQKGDPKTIWGFNSANYPYYMAVII